MQIFPPGVFRRSPLPESDGSSHWVIAVNDGKDGADELINIDDLIKMLLALLADFEKTQPQKVAPVMNKQISQFV